MKDKRETKEQVTANSYLVNSSANKGLISCLLLPLIPLSTRLYLFLSVYTDLQNSMVN